MKFCVKITYKNLRKKYANFTHIYRDANLRPKKFPDATIGGMATWQLQSTIIAAVNTINNYYHYN